MLVVERAFWGTHIYRTLFESLPYRVQDALRYSWSSLKYVYGELLPLPFPERSFSHLRPVILIPGSRGSPRYLSQLARDLQSSGRVGAIHTFSYKPHSMSDGVAKLKALIAEIAAEYKQEGLEIPAIDLVGHSQGAMIACEYAYVGAPDVRVHQVISIAGRLRPVGWPEWFYRDLIPNLKAIESAPKETLATIAASHDWLVPIDAVHVAPDIARQTTVLGAGHLSVINHQDTWDVLHNLLSTNY